MTRMENFETIVSTLDYILNTNRNVRHVTGGILLSIGMMFGGLALTVMTITNGDDSDE